MRKWLIRVLCLVLVATWMPWSVAAAEAQPMSLAELQEKYPHGAYWNHTEGGNEDYTWDPCTHHTGNCSYNGTCGCNTYRNKSIQCMGFAYQLAALAYADDPYTQRTANYDEAALDTLKAGDIVRYRHNGHSIFVTAVEGDTVTYADCNSDRSCGIRWNSTVSKSTLRSSFTYVKAAPYELPASLSVSAPATATVDKEIAVTLRYDGVSQPIGGVVGTLRYHADRMSYVSYAGEDVEVSADGDTIKYVYSPSAAEAPTSVAMAFTFRATALGACDFAVTTEEFVNDTDYTSLGNPAKTVTVAVVKPTLTVNYHGGGGEIANTVVAHTYQVTTKSGINMRKDAGTDHAKVTALPKGTAFTVAVTDVKDADGYTWGKTTFNGKTGWVVISDFVEKTGDVWGGAWTLTDGIICRIDGGALTHTLTRDEPIGQLADPTELGLTKAGHRFGGWNTAADGSGTLWTAGMKPPSDAEDAVTLYAVWIPILSGDADGNGQLNNRDLGLLQRYLNDWEVTLTSEADINGDGAVNNKDLGLLQQILNEWTMEEKTGC